MAKPAGVQIGVVFDREEVVKLDALAAKLSGPLKRLTRSDIVRAATRSGLPALEREASTKKEK